MRISFHHVISTLAWLILIVGGVVSFTISVESHPSLHALINSAEVRGNRLLMTIHVPTKTFLTASLVLFINLLYLLELLDSLELIEFNL